MPPTHFSQTGKTARRSWTWLAAVDRQLLSALIIVGCLGHFVLYSASNQDIDLVLRHAARFAFGLLVMLSLAQLPISDIQRWAGALFALSIALLLMVIFFGPLIKGAQRWLDFGVVRFQPSELLKLTLPLMLCGILSSGNAWFRWRYPLALIFTGIPAFIVASQPDLGTAIIIGIIGLLTIFLAGMEWRWISGLSLLGLSLTPVIWHTLLDYQKQRLLTFFEADADPMGGGYHIIQSKIAIGSGGLWGKGWLNGTQSQLDFIPERSTDFIFATFAEEFGFMGIVMLALLYVFIIWRCLLIAFNACGEFNRLLAGVIALSFFIHVIINISMVSSLIPVVGVPLPLMSFGGSYLVVLMASFGILMAIDRYQPIIKDKL